jgi:hypothetical protein
MTDDSDSGQPFRKRGRLIHHGETADNTPEEAVLGVLADLRHFCDEHELDYAAIDRRAYGQYLSERGQSTNARQTRRSDLRLTIPENRWADLCGNRTCLKAEFSLQSVGFVLLAIEVLTTGSTQVPRNPELVEIYETIQRLEQVQALPTIAVFGRRYVLVLTTRNEWLCADEPSPARSPREIDSVDARPAEDG